MHVEKDTNVESKINLQYCSQNDLQGSYCNNKKMTLVGYGGVWYRVFTYKESYTDTDQDTDTGAGTGTGTDTRTGRGTDAGAGTDTANQTISISIYVYTTSHAIEFSDPCNCASKYIHTLVLNISGKTQRKGRHNPTSNCCK